MLQRLGILIMSFIRCKSNGLEFREDIARQIVTNFIEPSNVAKYFSLPTRMYVFAVK